MRFTFLFFKTFSGFNICLLNIYSMVSTFLYKYPNLSFDKCLLLNFD